MTGTNPLPASAAAGPFSVMAKPAGSLCNMRCAYCYYRNTEYGSENGGPVMTGEVLEHFIRQYIEATGEPEINFTWHGGEPTLAGLDFYRLAVDLQKRYLPEGRKCRNNLQTNGLLLDGAWCAFLAKEQFDVGLSIDGTQRIHDRYRTDHNGHGTWQLASDAIKRLQSHGVQPDLLCTVTSSSAEEPLTVYRALRAFNTGWIQFIPIVRNSAESVSGEAYGKFLCAVFDEWILHDMGRLDIQLFAETMRIWSGGEAGLCWMAPVCGRVLILEKDGGIYSCDHFVDPDHRIGDILTSHIGELAGLPVQLRFGKDKRDKLTTECRSCKWLALCNGGCPKDRTKAENGGLGQNRLCAGLRQFFSYTEPAFKLVLQFAEKGLAPEEIMLRLRTMMQARWKGIGRNDPCPCGSGRKAKNCCWSKKP